MGYIIVWKNSHREPHVDVDTRSFKQEYNSYEDAKAEAEKVLIEVDLRSQWYFDYAIYKEVTS